MSYYEAWKRYRDFAGRTSRSAFWLAWITHKFLSIVLMFILAFGLTVASDLTAEEVNAVIRLTLSLFQLAFLVPCIAMTVRRLRDAGYSAKSFYWLLVPLIGGIAFFARLCTKSMDERKSE